MGRLRGDCFETAEGLMSLEAALALMAARVRPVAGVEATPLGAAEGRILAEDVVAPADLPPFDNAAMDGYALRASDLAGADGFVTLPVAGRVAAGATLAPGAPVAGAAIRIFTGAPLPAGLDAVVAQEDAGPAAEGHVALPPGIRAGLNVRRSGEDIRQGAVALRAGLRLRPQEIGLLAALGLDEVRARTRLRVAVFSTGDEIAASGEPLAPARRRDANRPALIALLARLGCAVSDLGILRDDRSALRTALVGAAGDHDLVVTSGGVSEGEEDHVRAAVSAEGALSFWRLALKPGKPVALGVVAGAAFLGLPGNPVSAFVTFCLLGRPLVARLAGETARPPASFLVEAAFARTRRGGGRREYLRARLREPAGRPVVELYEREGSGLITSLTETDGLVELAEGGPDIGPGDLVRFLPYGSFLP